MSEKVSAKKCLNGRPYGGQVRFLVLLADVVKSVSKLGNADAHHLASGVFYSMVDGNKND